MRYISEDEVDKNLQMHDVIESLREAFQYLALGTARYSPRNRISASEGVLNTMPAAVDPWNIAGLKLYYASTTGGKFVVVVMDTSQHEVRCVIEAGRLGQLRTGAVTALVSSMLVQEKDPVYTLIGAGYQAATQLDGILSMFQPAEIRIYSRTYERAEKFAAEKSEIHGIKIKALKNVHDALDGSTLISAITNSNDPIFSSADLGDRYHVNLAGGNLPYRSEADVDVLANADAVIVESIEQAKLESGEIIQYMQKFPGRSMMDIRDLFGRESYTGRFGKSVFKTMGIGLEDLAAAHVLMDNLGI